MNKKLNIILYILGIILALTVFVLIILNAIPLPGTIAILVIGIVLIVISPFKLLKL